MNRFWAAISVSLFTISLGTLGIFAAMWFMDKVWVFEPVLAIRILELGICLGFTLLGFVGICKASQ